MKKEIKSIRMEGLGYIYSDSFGKIEEFEVNGEMARVKWFRKGNEEFNGKYVLKIEYTPQAKD